MKFASCSGNVPAAQSIFLFRQHHHRPAFRSFIGQAGKLRGVGQFFIASRR